MNFDEAGNLILTDEVASGIHVAYQELYYNTKQTKNIRKGGQQQEEVVSSPKLSMNTYQISMKKKGETNLMEWF